jgi:hypothetical protein
VLRPSGLGTIFNYDKKTNIFKSNNNIFNNNNNCYYISFFIFFSAGSVDPAARASKPKGGQNRTRRSGLHLARGSAGQVLEFADLALWAATKRAGLSLAPKAGQTKR